MYEIEEITDNMDDGERWFSVVHNMDLYRVGGLLGSNVINEEGNEVEDPELRTEIINQVAKVVAGGQ